MPVEQKKQPVEDTLRITKNRNSKTLKGRFRAIKFRDKDTRQIIIYIPSLEVSGYGSTDKKAEEMVQFSLRECIENLAVLSADKLEVELRKLGWKRDRLKNKEFSNAYVDIDGQLQNFNAVADSVEHLTLVA